MVEARCFIYLNKKYVNVDGVTVLGDNGLSLLIGKKNDIEIFLKKNDILLYHYDIISHNARMNLLDYTSSNVRVEPGAIIRENVILEPGAIVLMNAVINVGSKIGTDTMIDMGAVIGSGVSIGKNCHVGANAVIAGILEPPSKTGVVIEDNVFIGANAVILEGVHIGKNSIIGALSLVNKDVPENCLVRGIPCTITPILRDSTKEKCKLNDELRK